MDGDDVNPVPPEGITNRRRLYGVELFHIFTEVLQETFCLFCISRLVHNVPNDDDRDYVACQNIARKVATAISLKEVPIVDIWAEYARLRDEEGWTQKQIANAKGVSRSVVGDRLRF